MDNSRSGNPELSDLEPKQYELDPRPSDLEPADPEHALYLQHRRVYEQQIKSQIEPPS
jgi:hypothetical protein